MKAEGRRQKAEGRNATFLTSAFCLLPSAVTRHRFAFALLATLATILFIAPLIKQEVFSLRDHHDYFQPLRLFTAEELRAGRLPFWNPYNASGEAWLANPQTGVFYPPAWLFVVLPFETAYMLFLLLHLVILGWGAYLLFTRFASPGAAMVGAAALMFSGPVLSLLDVSNNLATFAWIPMALWCASVGAWRRGGMALALAFLGGEPFFASLAALMYVVVRRRRDVLGTALIAFGLTAIQLLPFLDVVSRSDRSKEVDGTAMLMHSMTSSDWLRLALPSAAPADGQRFILVAYVGMSVLALAIIGLTAIRRRREVFASLALLACAALIAAGPSLLTRLPLTLFRYPARMLPFVSLSVAALAVIGWDRLRGHKRWLDLLVVLVVVADLLPRARPLLHSEPFRRHPVPYDASIGQTAKILRFGAVDFNHRDAWMTGYLNLYDRRFDAFTPAPVIDAHYLRYYRALVESPTHTELATAAIGFTITSHTMPPPLQPIARHGAVTLYAHRYLAPMAAHIWSEPLAMRPLRVSFDTSSATVKVNAPHDGILVLRQQAAPGWRVTVDGKPARAVVADGVFRGVSLVKGRHQVIWTYRPPLFSLGAVMTLVTCASLVSAVFVKHRRA